MSAPKKPKGGREVEKGVLEKARSFPWGPGLKPLKRRTFLRGAVGGAAIGLALPTLDAMLGPSGAHADGTTAGPIFGVFFWANGLPWHAGMGGETAGVTYPDLWTPTATGAGFAPSELLMPLARHRVSVVTGLEPKTEVPPNPPGQSDGHMRGFMVAMTGDRIRPEGFDHPSHTLTALRPTLDQYVARHAEFYGDQPSRFRSVQIGISEARFHDYGHWNAISYNGPDSLNLPILRPTQLHDQLFSVPDDLVALGRRARMMDAVMDDARALQTQLGARDRARLDEHLTHLSEIQRRLDLAAATCETPARPVDSGDVTAKLDAMSELLAIALRCNLTRVFSLMLTSPATTHVFSNLGVTDGLHKTCHDGLWDRVRVTQAHQMELFARFLDVLAGTTEPTGTTLLDRCAIWGTSEYSEGWKHGTSEMPVVIAGGACGGLRTGVHAREPRGNLCKAQLTLLRSIGLSEASWGWNGGETSDVFGELLG